jgi:hypothetical protein
LWRKTHCFGGLPVPPGPRRVGRARPDGGNRTFFSPPLLNPERRRRGGEGGGAADFAVGRRNPNPIRQMACSLSSPRTLKPEGSASATSFARAVSRRSPHRHPPCVFRSPTPFSACSQHTGCPACVCSACRTSALFSDSTHHRLHYRSPFGFHFCFRSVPFRICSTYWV